MAQDRPRSLGGKCRKCGGWTETKTLKLCLECMREVKEAKKIECGLEGCTTLFKRGARARYCLVHRGLTTGERRIALAELAKAAG